MIDTLLRYFGIDPIIEKRNDMASQCFFTEITMAIQNTVVPKALKIGFLIGLYSYELVY